MHFFIIGILFLSVPAWHLLKKALVYYRCLNEKRFHERARQERQEGLVMSVVKKEGFLEFTSATGKKSAYPTNWFYEESVINPSDNFGPNRRRMYIWEETGLDILGPVYVSRGTLPVSFEAFCEIKKHLKRRLDCQKINGLLSARFQKSRLSEK
jgi:hypothetical protein